MNEGGERLAARRLPEGLEGIRRLHELLADLVEDPGEVVIGIETDRGLWVHALAAAGYEVYAINPLAAARYRERHNVGGAKSDAGDAKVLADLVRTDRHNHRPIAADSPGAEAVKVLARGHQNLIWSRNRHTNQLRNALREYYPAALEAFSDLADRDALAVLGEAPTPAPGAALSLSQLRSTLQRGGRQRNLDQRAGEIQVALRGSTPAAPAALAGRSPPPRGGGRDHRGTQPSDQQPRAVLTDHFEQHPDADIYLSLPGLGDVLGARVLGEFGDDPDRYASAKSRKNYAGTSPLTVASGKKRAVLARHIRNRRLYDAIDQWAFCSCPTARAAAPTTTNDGPPGTFTTKRCGRSATDLSASSTAVYTPNPLQRSHRLGAPTIGALSNIAA